MEEMGDILLSLEGEIFYNHNYPELRKVFQFDIFNT